MLPEYFCPSPFPALSVCLMTFPSFSMASENSQVFGLFSRSKFSMIQPKDISLPATNCGLSRPTRVIAAGFERTIMFAEVERSTLLPSTVAEAVRYSVYDAASPCEISVRTLQGTVSEVSVRPSSVVQTVFPSASLSSALIFPSFGSYFPRFDAKFSF